MIYLEYGLIVLATNLLMSLVLIVVGTFVDAEFRKSLCRNQLDSWRTHLLLLVLYFFIVAGVWPYAFYRVWTYGEEA